MAGSLDSGSWDGMFYLQHTFAVLWKLRACSRGPACAVRRDFLFNLGPNSGLRFRVLVCGVKFEDFGLGRASLEAFYTP